MLPAAAIRKADSVIPIRDKYGASETTKRVSTAGPRGGEEVGARPGESMVTSRVAKALKSLS